MALNFNYRGGSSSSTGSGVQYCVGGVPKIPLAHFKAASTSPPRPGACAKKRQHVASTTGHPSPPPPPPPLQGDATKTDPHGAAAVGGARDGSTSSTPHAPRRKKLLGSSSSLLLAGGGGGGGGGGLGQQRSFLDSSLIEKAVMGKEGGTWGVAHAQDRKEAWHTSAPSVSVCVFALHGFNCTLQLDAKTHAGSKCFKCSCMSMYIYFAGKENGETVSKNERTKSP